MRDTARVAMDGRSFRPTVLGHRERDGFVITGVAVVQTGEQVSTAEPERLASELSRIGLDAPECPRTLVGTTDYAVS